jgi:hypothetical protein
MQTINSRDRGILRGAAKHKLDLHHSEGNQQNLKDWFLHNTFRGVRPMIHLEAGSFWNEVFPKRLQCEGQLARDLEMRLYEDFVNYEAFNDDHPVTDNFFIQWRTRHIPFGIDVKIIHASDETGDTLGYRFEHPIRDLEEDFHKFGASIDTFDRAGTLEYAAAAEDAFGDILPVKIGAHALYCCPTQFVVYLMGMETMMISMYDHPELFHRMMKQYTEDMIAYFRYLEQNGAANPTTGPQRCGQGTWCFTDELPSSGEVTSKQMWGFMDSQETVGVSPAMFEEFIFPYYKTIAGEYGLLSYGCCEPVHAFWENCLSKLDNLRKISVSPWCDEEYMGAMLRGRKIIFHRKPSANYLGVGEHLDEDAIRKHIRRTLKAAKGCTLEITQRDVYTISNNEAKARRYVEIIREEIAGHW